MDSRRIIWFGMAVGSVIGGYIPMLWGASGISFSSIIFAAVGGLLGIYLCFKLTR